jgi:hypothetical protein
MKALVGMIDSQPCETLRRAKRWDDLRQLLSACDQGERTLVVSTLMRALAWLALLELSPKRCRLAITRAHSLTRFSRVSSFTAERKRP